MAAVTEQHGEGRVNPWRVAGWGSATLILLAPLVAMQFTDEVAWTGLDFAYATLLLLGVGIPLEIAVRKRGDGAYRLAVGVALVAAFLLMWINGAVGIIGSEDNAANLMYVGVLAIGFISAVIARFRAAGMARAMFLTAGGIALVGVVALAFSLDTRWQVMALNLFFVAAFTASGVLFGNAAVGRPLRTA